MCVNNHPVRPVIPGYGLFGCMCGFMCAAEAKEALIVVLEGGRGVGMEE